MSTSKYRMAISFMYMGIIHRINTICHNLTP